MALFNYGNSQLKDLKKIADKIVSLEKNYNNLSDEELRKQTKILKDRIDKGETLDQILPEAYAIMCEAASRVLNMRHRYVQILGGIALHQGRITEMATGEGKTLVATLPTFLNALTGKGVHVVTANDYLAKRDAEWMGKVYKFLGLSVGVVTSGMSTEERREAYSSDVCYCTSNELGFDYLRDNMALDKSQKVQRGLNYAIVDEVDSILIDDARNPLVISGSGQRASEGYIKAQEFANRLIKDLHFEIDEKTKMVYLTELGVAEAENFYNIDNLADASNIETYYHINNAIKANFAMTRDENYIVKDGKVLIIDDNTGRVMQGRKYSEGLHQAIEAKEGVAISDENRTLATITYQNLFRQYKKLSGMSGTAKTEEEEFQTIYGLDVIEIPSHKPSKRKDENDKVYVTERGKINAIVEEIKECYKSGRPVLIGTATVEKSEVLSKALDLAGIPHSVLNAKNHEKESEIVAQAGKLHAVTIATNMAGRGTDISLGGNAEFMAKEQMRDEGFSEEQISYATAYNTINDPELNRARERYKEIYKLFKNRTDREKEEVKKLGGLYVIGTERQDSRRIDNQLRGRAGRQGDPGETIFYLSLEDELLKRFGDERIERIKATALKYFGEDTPIQSKLLTKIIEDAQKNVEYQNFAVRKNTVKYDLVLNRHREIIYKDRDAILNGLPIHNQLKIMSSEIIKNIVNSNLPTEQPSKRWNLAGLKKDLQEKVFGLGLKFSTEELIKGCTSEDIERKLNKIINEKYEHMMQEAKLNGVDFEKIARVMLLSVVDQNWRTHVDNMQSLKNNVAFRAYANEDPLMLYNIEAHKLFDDMKSTIYESFVKMIFNSKVSVKKVEERKNTISLKEPPKQKSFDVPPAFKIPKPFIVPPSNDQSKSVSGPQL